MPERDPEADGDGGAEKQGGGDAVSGPVREPEAFAWTGDVPRGVSLLVAGPPMTGKRTLLYRILAGDRDPGWARLLVTTRKSGETVAREYRQIHPEVDDERLVVVDCVSDQRGVDVVRSDTRRFTHDPGDLTGVGIHVTEFMRRFDGDPGVEGVAVGLHTLSTMLMYTSLKRVYQFLHVLTGRIETAGFRGTFVMDERAGSQRLDTLAQPFDGLVEVRTDGGREYRVRGIDAGPDAWTRF